MSTIIAAGLSIRYRARLQGQLKNLDFLTASKGQQVIDQVEEHGDVSAIILDDGLVEPSPEEVLETIQDKRIPVIFCCGDTKKGDYLKDLVRRLGVQLVLYKPLDPEELVRHTALMVGAAVPRKKNEEEDEMTSRLRMLWDKYKPINLERLENVTRGLNGLQEGNLDEETRRNCEREAHKLAGGLGTFGFPKAALLSRELERALQANEAITPENVDRLMRLVDMIQQEISGDVQASTKATAEETTPSGDGELEVRLLLLLSEDESVAQEIGALASKLGAQVKQVTDWAQAREIWISQSPELVILDLAEDTSGERFALYRDLGTRLTHVPVLALLSKANLANAETFTSLVGRTVLLKPLQENQLTAAAKKILSRAQALRTRILAVDDDPQILDALSSLLTPLRLEVNTLSDPLDFWDAVESAPPDLVILDIDMPFLNGIEICRSIRSNERWYQLPVIFLSVYNDTETINRLFLAGADDYVSKPFVGPELVTRISNRLARSGTNVVQEGSDELDSRTRNVAKIRTYLEQAARDQTQISLALVEVDKHAKLVEKLGKVRVDRIMDTVGRRLTKELRNNDVVARWGKAEMLLCCNKVTKSVAANRLEHLLETCLREEFNIDGQSVALPLTASVGIAQFPEDSEKLPQLLRACDTALGIAKGSGGNRIVLAENLPTEKHEPDEYDIVSLGEALPTTTEALKALHERGLKVYGFSEVSGGLEQLAAVQPEVQGRVVLFNTTEELNWDHVATLGRWSRLMAVTHNDQEMCDAFDQDFYDTLTSDASPTAQLKRLERALEA